MDSFLYALADALQAPLRNIACVLNPSAVTVGVGLGNSGSLGIVYPTSCGQPVAPEISPIVGGQCPVLYNVSVGVLRPDGSPFAPIPFANVQGPITGVGGEWIEDFAGNLRYVAFIIAPNDTEPPTPGFRKFGPFTGYTDNQKASRTYLIGISRVDGLPDNCGNSSTPPPPPPPPQTGTLTNITVNFGGLTYNLGAPSFTVYPTVHIPVYGGLHIPINLTFSPSFAFPGGINLPIYLRLPELTINTPISFFNFDLSPEIRAPEIKVDFPDPATVVPAGIDYVERIVGVNINSVVTQPSRVSEISGEGGGSSLQVPWLAIVRFIPPAGFSDNEAVDVPVKTESQFVPCPWFYGADGYTVIENVGVETSHSAVTGEVANLIKPV